MNITKIYYMPFDVSTAFPVSLRTFRTRPNELAVNKIAPDERSFVLAYLTSNRLCAGKFEEAFLRMVAELSSGRTILVDSNGCVKFGAKQYFMHPGAFLHLFKIMAGIVYQQRRE